MSSEFVEPSLVGQIPLGEFTNGNQPRDDYAEWIYRKLSGAWGSAIGYWGYGDPTEVAYRLYDALYAPEHLEEGMDSRAKAANPSIAEEELPSRVVWSETRVTLLTPVGIRGNVPSDDEFVSTVANTILQGADMASVVLPGARRQIDHILDQGDRLAIWSAGHREHQHRKIGGIGLYNSVEIEDIRPPVVVSSVHGEPLEVETVIAPNKTTTEVLTRVREIADGRQIVVVDDRVNNLQAFCRGVPETRAALWVQFGVHARRAQERLVRGDAPGLKEAIFSGLLTPLSGIDQLCAMIAYLRTRDTLNKEQTVLFSDYDDTLSDNIKRRALEFRAVIETLVNRGWV
jgi:hypothetical protein